MKRNLITKSMNRAIAWAVALISLGASVAQAHPGHDLFNRGTVHVLTSLDHLLVLSAAGAIIFGLGFFARRSRTRQAFQFTGALLAGGALTVWGLA